MTEVVITPLPAAQLHVLEIWSNPVAVAERFAAELGFPLASMNRASGNDTLRLLRFEPTAWLVEGDPAPLAAVLGDDGTLTAIGGGLVRVRLSGPAWRTLLMEGGVFDAENPAFAPGHTASTIIDHVNVRLHVVAEDECIAYVPASFGTGLLHFWSQAVKQLAI